MNQLGRPAWPIRQCTLSADLRTSGTINGDSCLRDSSKFGARPATRSISITSNTISTASCPARGTHSAATGWTNTTSTDSIRARCCSYALTNEPAMKIQTRLDLLRSPARHASAHPHRAVFGTSRSTPYQMWLDGIYMADAFYAQYEAAFERSEAISESDLEIASSQKTLTRNACTARSAGLTPWDDIAHQISHRSSTLAMRNTACSTTPGTKASSSAGQIRTPGARRIFGERAIGWYVHGDRRCARFFAARSSAAQRTDRHFRSDDLALARMQDAESGVWCQVLDQGNRPGQLSFESSASCMFVYAIVKGVRIILPKDLLAIARQGTTVSSSSSYKWTGRTVHLTDLPQCGLGRQPYRDGSYEYYVSEPVVTDNHHGVGAFLLASSEIEKL